MNDFPVPVGPIIKAEVLGKRTELAILNLWSCSKTDIVLIATSCPITYCLKKS
jgi:hypothetical protein